MLAPNAITSDCHCTLHSGFVHSCSTGSSKRLIGDELQLFEMLTAASHHLLPSPSQKGSCHLRLQCTLQHKSLSSSSQDLCSRLLADTHALHCETLGLLLMRMLFSMLLSLTGPTSAAAVQWENCACSQMVNG